MYREKIVDRLFSGMLSPRFAELAQKPDAPFLDAAAGRGRSSRARGNRRRSARWSRTTASSAAWRRCSTEAERVARFGFTATELDRQKQNLLRSYERIVAEKDNRESSAARDEYIRNFLAAETLPTVDDEYALHQRFLPQITLDEINRLAREWFPRSATASSSSRRRRSRAWPSRTRRSSPRGQGRGSAKSLTAYVDTVGGGRAARCGACRPRDSCAKTTTKDAVGITEWELSNGVKVVLKPTTFKEDEIVFRARPARAARRSRATQDYIPASTATQVITRRRPRQVQRDRSAEGADRQSRVGEPVHRRARGRAERRRLAQGSGDDVPADLPDGSRSRAPTRRRSPRRPRR